MPSRSGLLGLEVSCMSTWVRLYLRGLSQSLSNRFKCLICRQMQKKLQLVERSAPMN